MFYLLSPVVALRLERVLAVFLGSLFFLFLSQLHKQKWYSKVMLETCQSMLAFFSRKEHNLQAANSRNQWQINKDIVSLTTCSQRTKAKRLRLCLKSTPSLPSLIHYPLCKWHSVGRTIVSRKLIAWIKTLESAHSIESTDVVTILPDIRQVGKNIGESTLVSHSSNCNVWMWALMHAWTFFHVLYGTLGSIKFKDI